MIEKGLVYGRFQILHLKHVEYILAAKMRCKRLYIGITMSDDLHVSGGEEDNYRVRRSANPLTYIERYEMLRDTLLSFGVPREEFEIIPFPISQPDLILQYAPKDATYYMSICTEWDEEKYRILGELGVNREVLWRRNPEEMGVTGKIIRELITEQKEWQQHVPRTVADYIVTHGLDRRIRDLNLMYRIPGKKE